MIVVHCVDQSHTNQLGYIAPYPELYAVCGCKGNMNYEGCQQYAGQPNYLNVLCSRQYSCFQSNALSGHFSPSFVNILIR